MHCSPAPPPLAAVPEAVPDAADSELENIKLSFFFFFFLHFF